LLFNLLYSGGAQRHVLTLCKELQVSERTARRWLRFWKAVCLRTKWWREFGGRFGLMSGSIIDLFEILKLKHSLEISCEIMAKESAHLWVEIRMNVGDRVYAEDA
jgi:hypothetical protein